MFEVGALVQNYRILRKLGEGGMGVVYAAEHVILGRPAAVKVLHPWAAQDAEVAQRFINEARAAAAFKHDNIVPVQDCGQLPTGQWFIALDLLAGESLAAFLGRHAGQPVDPLLILHILGEAGAGLHAAHERGIVHRDVKPDNIFLTRTTDDPWRAVVLDFGIAKLGEDGHGIRTRDRVVMGTLAYMAPEQLLHGAASVDRRADVYALAMIAYEMATGHNPLAHLEKITQVVGYHMAGERPPDPHKLRADLPKPFCKALLRGLEPDPRKRWPDVPAFLQPLALATPRPGWPEGGMSILSHYAPEVSKAGSEARTAGRVVPSALLDGPSNLPITAPGRPGAMPPTISDGVPRDPSAPGTARLDEAPSPAVPYSTIGHSSGQSVSPLVPASRSRGLLFAAAAGVGAVAIAVVLVLALRGGDDPTAREPESSPEPAPVVSADAAGPEPVATSALAIVTEPVGAVVLVDRVSRGPSPLNLPLPVGAQVVVRAEMPGYLPAEQSVTIEPTPAAVRLVLVPVAVDAGPTPVVTREPSSKPERRRRDRDKPAPEPDKPKPEPKPEPPTPTRRFNPDDAAGD